MKSNQSDMAYEKAKKKIAAIREFYNHLSVFVIVNLIIGSAVWYFGGSLKFFLLIGVTGWGIGLLVHAIKAFNWNPLLSQDWEQRKLKEIMEEEIKKQ
jgi:hypothetical protein